MSARPDKMEELKDAMDVAYRKRKQEQTENKEIYERALDELKDIIMEEEGPEIKEELRERRTLWVTDQIAQDKFPDNLEDFYKTKLKADEPPDEDAGGGKDGKKDKDKKADKKADKKDKKDKGKGKKGKEEPEEEGMPKLQGKTELVVSMQEGVEVYEKVWDGKDETENFQQRHDIELGKEVVRPGVYEDLRKQVDEMLVLNLKKIKSQLAPGGKGKGKKGKERQKR